MTAIPQDEDVRQLVVQAFHELGLSEADIRDLHETLLIDGRRCLARSYRAGHLLAMWLLQAGVVQFYDGEGSMVATLRLFQKPRHRSAA